MSTNTILLVDDNQQDVFLTQRVLKKAGFHAETVVANDGIEALDYLFGRGKYAQRDTQEMPVVTLLDLKMPRVDGFEVLRQARAQRLTSHLPIVVLTSSKEDSDVILSYKLGCNAFVSKPVDFQQFSASIEGVVSYFLSLDRHASQP